MDANAPLATDVPLLLRLTVQVRRYHRRRRIRTTWLDRRLLIRRRERLRRRSRTDSSAVACRKAIPLTGLLNIERRHGHDEFVIEKALVKTGSPSMQYFTAHRAAWAEQDCFARPARASCSPTALQQPITVALNSGADSLSFKIG